MEVTRFNNVRLVLDALAQAWVTRPSSKAPAVLKAKAHIERYLKSFSTIRISRGIFPPTYRFRVNVAIKRGKGTRGRRRDQERSERNGIHEDEKETLGVMGACGELH